MFIDTHGLPGLTMRRLGNELGVEAMALYRYVPGKEDLLDAVVDELIEGMRKDVDVLDAPRDGWQDFLHPPGPRRTTRGPGAPEGLSPRGVAPA